MWVFSWSLLRGVGRSSKERGGQVGPKAVGGGRKLDWGTLPLNIYNVRDRPKGQFLFLVKGEVRFYS